MNLHQRGIELIQQLKDHVLEVLRSHPEAGPDRKGDSPRRGRSPGGVAYHGQCGIGSHLHGNTEIASPRRPHCTRR